MTDGQTNSLRQKLIDSDGFGDKLSELRADRALAAVVDWGRDELCSGCRSTLADAIDKELGK